MREPTGNGVVITVNGVATISFRRRLPYPIERVWTAITDPAERAAWFGPTVIEPRVGGAIEMTAEGPPAPATVRRIAGKILVWDPPRVFEHEWRQAIVEDGSIRYELEPDGDGTFLTLLHRGLSVKNAVGFLPGTHAFLDRLEAIVAGEPLPSWMARYNEAKQAYSSLSADEP